MTQNNNWSRFKLHPDLEKNLISRGFNRPTEVQSQSLYYLNFPTDLIIASKTGSGKTLCYVLPILNN